MKKFDVNKNNFFKEVMDFDIDLEDESYLEEEEESFESSSLNRRKTKQNESRTNLYENVKHCKIC